MLPRSQRLSVEQFNSVMEKGRAHHSSLFLLRAMKVDSLKAKVGTAVDQKPVVPRVSATVPNKIAKKATERNRLRRVIYEAVAPIFPEIKADQYIVVFAKGPAASASFVELKKEMRDIFVKAGLLR